MTQVTLMKIVGLGVVTGMRSMAGLTTLAWARSGAVKPVMAILAAGEMFADKTAVVGDRTDALPLAGRALMGAVVGAVVATHLAFRLRRRLPFPSAANGLLEDAVVLAAASLIGTQARERRA